MKTRQIFLLMIGSTLLILLLAGCGAPASQISQTPESQAAIAPTATLPTVASTVEIAYTTDICLNNTRNEAECKDCCDSLDADGATRKACRDACPTHDFGQNSDFVVVDAPSILGPNGDYGICTLAVDERSCKECCDGSSDLQGGDRRFCRDACAQSPAGSNSPEQKPDESDRAPGAELERVSGGYVFSEGPTVDQNGDVYFSDVVAGRIFKWSPDGSVDVFLDGLNGPNGLAFDGNGMLIVCEGGNGRLISIDPQGQITVLANQYNQIQFNEPNDLWIDPQGGIYFTDPAYQSPVVQDGENVYYLTPDRGQIVRVISDLVKPNGIIGTDDGQTLYVTDHGAGQTFVYDINADGTLSNGQLFASVGSDGMTLDVEGNLYLTTPNQVQVFDAAGNHLRDIPTQEQPTNVTFGGTDNRTLFITARTEVYTFQMPVDDPVTSPDTESFTLSSPDVVAGGALPTEYTCDGDSATLPLAWSGAPAETESFAVVMSHVPGPGDTHWYWVLYDIPADVGGLPKNSAGIGTLGTNSVNGNTEYAPPCSQGPGEKVYTYTVYALSAHPQFSVPASQVSLDVLLAAIQDTTLASAKLNVSYTR